MNVIRCCRFLLPLLCGLVFLLPAAAQDKKAPDLNKEEAYYPLEAFTIPEHISLEAGSLEWLPNKQLAISTRRGDIFIVEDPFAKDISDVNFKLWASGLHEVLGLAYKDGWLYCTQRCEVTRMKDTNNDGKADVFETVSDGWEINGDYHEYAFGSKFDKEGNIWVVLCLTGSFTSDVKYRGWCLRINSEGKLVPTCSGIRSPGGIGMNCAGDMFYTDNQGPWNGACALKWLKPGSFQGHPGGNKWYKEKEAAEAMGPEPTAPVTKSRLMVEAKKIPELEPPCCYFPYPEMGQSAAGVACDTTGGKFGPFAGQLFVTDQSHSTVMRVTLEKVKGHYQGACIPFRQGFTSGALSLVFDDASGTMFSGGTNRGWGSRGSKPDSLDRVTWSGLVPFEIHEMHAKNDGFEVTFTQPVDAEKAGDVKSYTMKTYQHIYQADYGSPKVDDTKPKITKAEVSADKKSVRLTVDKIVEGHVHELHLDGVLNGDGRKLLHPVAYYSLNYIPE